MPPTASNRPTGTSAKLVNALRAANARGWLLVATDGGAEGTKWPFRAAGWGAAVSLGAPGHRQSFGGVLRAFDKAAPFAAPWALLVSVEVATRIEARRAICWQ